MKVQHHDNAAEQAREWPTDRDNDTKATQPRVSAAESRSDLDTIDALSVYMSQIGEVALLTREQEVELAIEIEQANREIRDAVFRLPFAVRYVEELAARVRDGRASMREIVAHARGEEEPGIEDRLRTFLTGVTRLERTSRMTTVGGRRERAVARVVSQLHDLELGRKTVASMIAKLEEGAKLIAGHERALKRVERRAGMTVDEIIKTARRCGASAALKQRAVEVRELRAAVDAVVATLGTSRDALRESMRTIRRQRAAADGVRDRFTRANLRLVVMVAKRYANRGLPLPDLIQEGNIGLMYAVDRFDHRMGCKFSTYAVHWIRQAIARLLQKQTRVVSVPSYMREIVAKVLRSARELRAELGCEPNVDEIATHAEVPRTKVLEVLDLTAQSVSMDEPVGDSHDRSLHDVIEDYKTPEPDAVVDMDLDARVERLIDALRDRESAVLRMRFGLGTDTDYALEEVGAHFGVSRERARQIESEALRRLRMRR